MFLTRRAWLLMVLCASVSTSAAFAGGDNGGSKRNGKVTVRNQTNAPIGVTSKANSAAIQAAIQAKDVQAFQDAGGRIVNPGQSTTFSLKSGSHAIGVGDATFANTATFDANVQKGQTTTLNVTSGAGGALSITKA